MTPKTARRSFLSGAIAGIAGVLGFRAGEARAEDRPGYEYRVPWQTAGGHTGGTFGPCEDLGTAIEQHHVHIRMGHTARVERRAVGPWERYEAAEYMTGTHRPNVDVAGFAAELQRRVLG